MQVNKKALKKSIAWKTSRGSLGRSLSLLLPDILDLVVVEINFKDDGKFSESSFGQLTDFVALLKIFLFA